MNEENLQRAQSDIADRLAADSWFSTITILEDRKGNTVSEAQKVLGAMTAKAGKVGTCAVVMQPKGTVAKPNLPVAIMDLDITVLVLEDPAINDGQTGTGKNAMATARRIVDVLYQFSSQGVLRMMLPDNPTYVPVDDIIAPVAIEVRFKSMEDFRTQAVKVSQPGYSTPQTALPYTMTLSCATSGADIYYTLDGSYPSPLQGSKYTAPFAVTTAASLRLGAVKAAMIDSDISLKNLS